MFGRANAEKNRFNTYYHNVINNLRNIFEAPPLHRFIA